MGGTIYSYGGGRITFSGRNWRDDLATPVPSATLQPVNSLVKPHRGRARILHRHVHGRSVWVHDPHPDAIPASTP